MAVTIAQVKEVIDTSLTDDQITAFITMASNLVTDKLASETCLSAGAKTDIELLLSAHFLSMRDQRVKVEKTGDASFTYQGMTGMGLEATLYGQQAIALDCSGVLANLSKQTMEWETV
jgi:microcystin degradation protein MlrC